MVEIYIPLAGVVDVAKEKSRLEKVLKDTQLQIKRLEKLLSGDFASKVPMLIVDKEREKLTLLKEKSEKFKAQVDSV